MVEFDDYAPEQTWSSREIEILHLLEDGLTNREIAQRLILSPETVKWYNKQIFDKLGVSTRGQAAARAREQGLLDQQKGEEPILMASRPSNLPVQATSFIGRQRQLSQIKDLLQSARLVTLTGPGGTGKTRLALQVSNGVTGHYTHGVIFVNLAQITEPVQVPEAIAQEIDLIEKPGQPLSESLSNYFATKHTLLLLDNFEHVLPAAPLLSDLLAHAPRLTILATSRESLRLNGEHEYPVPPLTVPDLANVTASTTVANSEAVDLFLQRARAARPDFELTQDNMAAIAAVCIRLEGLPLAIELAAARLKLFSPPQLLDRLESRLEVLKGGPRDLPVRQRTLRDTLDWSYDLLQEGEKRLFWRLAVFVGGRTIDAVEAICAPQLGIDPLDGLESLLHKSLIFQEEGPGPEPRFIMLETIHEYARERLAASGEEQLLKDRHLAYFAEFSQAMETGYRGQNQINLLARTSAEKGNIRAALGWAVERGQIEVAAQIISSLDYFWFYHDSPVEDWRWISRVMPHLEAVSPALQPRFLVTAGHLAWINNHLSQARQFWQEAAHLAIEVGDKLNEAWAKLYLSGNTDQPHSFDANWQSAEEAIAIFQELDYQPGLAQGYNILGELARMAGNDALAREKYEVSMALSRQTGEVIRQNMLLENLSMTYYNQGDFRLAWETGQEALRRFRRSGTVQGVVSSLWIAAGPLTKLGQAEKATRLLGATDALLVQIGAASQPTDFDQLMKYTAEARAQLGDAAFQDAWDEGQTLTLEQAVALALES